MKRLYYILIVLCMVMVGCRNNNDSSTEIETEDVEIAIQEVRYEYGIPIDSFIVIEGTIQQGETLGKLFQNLGATQQQISELNTIDRTVFDTRMIRADKQYLALYDADSTLTYFIYLPSVTESITFQGRQ